MAAESPAILPPPPSLRSLLGLAWPIILTRATQSVIGFCDALMVAPLGESPLAAVTTGALNCFTFIILPMGTVFILQSFAAQLRGRGELESLPRYAWYGLILALLFGVLAVLSIPLVPRLLSTFGYAADVESAMSTYMSIRLLSVGAVVGVEALANWYGGLGNTRIGMVASIVAMVANVLGCYVLVQPRFGLPGFGVAGAAWASVGASFLGFAVVGYRFFRGHGYEKIAGPLRLRSSELLRVLRFGLPNGVNWFLEFAAFVLYINVVVGHLGTTVLAAFNVVMQINSVSFMPAFGLSSAGAILVGEAIGARALDRVWPLVKLTGAVAMAWMAAVGLLYLLVPNELVGLFRPGGGDSTRLVETGVGMLMLATLWQLSDALNLTFSEALRAAGDTAWIMAARLILAWVLFMPAAWVSVRVLGGGVGTVMASLIIYVSGLTVLLGARFASGRWRSIDLVGTEPRVA